MVIKRTIENLKERPHEERRAVASMIAFSVVGILLLVWAITFLFRLGDLSAPDTSQIVSPTTEPVSPESSVTQ